MSLTNCPICKQTVRSHFPHACATTPQPADLVRQLQATFDQPIRADLVNTCRQAAARITQDAERIKELERQKTRLQDQWDVENKLVIKYGDRAERAEAEVARLTAAIACNENIDAECALVDRVNKAEANLAACREVIEAAKGIRSIIFADDIEYATD